MTTFTWSRGAGDANQNWAFFVSRLVDFKRWALHHLIEEEDGFNWNYFDGMVPNHLHPPHEWAASHVFTVIDEWSLYRGEAPEPTPQFILSIGRLGETDNSPAEEAIIELAWLTRIGMEYFFLDPLSPGETHFFIDFLRWAQAWIERSDSFRPLEVPISLWQRWQAQSIDRKSCTPEFEAWVRDCYDFQLEHWEQALSHVKEAQPGRYIDPEMRELLGIGLMNKTFRDILHLDRQDFVSPFATLPDGAFDEAPLFASYRELCRDLERDLLPLALEILQLSDRYWSRNHQWSPTASDVAQQFPDMMHFFDELEYSKFSPHEIGPVQTFAVILGGGIPHLKLLGFPDRRFREIEEIIEGTPPPTSIGVLTSGSQPMWLPRLHAVWRWLQKTPAGTNDGFKRGEAIVDWPSAESFFASIDADPSNTDFLAEQRAQQVFKRTEEQRKLCHSYLSQWREVIAGATDDDVIDMIASQSLDLDYYLDVAASVFGFDFLRVTQLRAIFDLEPDPVEFEDEPESDSNSDSFHASPEEISNYWHRAIELHDQLRKLEVTFTEIKSSLDPLGENYELVLRSLSEGLTTEANRMMTWYSRDILKNLNEDANLPEAQWIQQRRSDPPRIWWQFHELAPKVRTARLGTHSH
jgi:hypothetical protein